MTSGSYDTANLHIIFIIHQHWRKFETIKIAKGVISPSLLGLFSKTRYEFLSTFRALSNRKLQFGVLPLLSKQELKKNRK